MTKAKEGREIHEGEDIRWKKHDVEEYGVVVSTKIANSLQGPKQFLLVVDNTRLGVQQTIEAHMILERKLPKASDKKEDVPKACVGGSMGFIE